MSTRTRLVTLGLLVVAVAIAFVVARPGDKKTTPGGSQVSATVTVKNGKPLGGIKKISLNKGDHLHLTIHSDVADEIHIHGYNYKKDVKAGGSVAFAFTTSIDGIFVIELENHKEQIAQLEVAP